jgi:hypothetical protein
MEYKNILSTTKFIKVNNDFKAVCPGEVIELEQPINEYGLISTASKSINMDLNRDGKIDKKDISIASKVMAHAKKLKKTEK